MIDISWHFFAFVFISWYLKVVEDLLKSIVYVIAVLCNILFYKFINKITCFEVLNSFVFSFKIQISTPLETKLKFGFGNVLKLKVVDPST